MMNRRQFFATSATLAAVTACEQRKVRLWLAEFKQGEIPWLCLDKPTTYRDVEIERLVPSLKMGDPLQAGIAYRAGDLGPGDALMRRRVKDGDPLRFWEQVWVVCRVEVLL